MFVPTNNELFGNANVANKHCILCDIFGFLVGFCANLQKFFVLWCVSSCFYLQYFDMEMFLLNVSRYSITKAFCVVFVMTFFSAFDVPVFWPILLFYWVVLFTLTMRRQISHMIKYKYLPFSSGKQVNY